MNLTGERDPGRALTRHPAESLAALPHVPASARHLLDLGSGNGYPALVIAASRPALRVTLVEASRRKAAFLRAVVRDGGLDRVAVRELRLSGAEELGALAPFDLFSSRAVAGAARWTVGLAGRIEAGGRALLFLGPREADEVAMSAADMGLRVERLPLPTRKKAALLVVHYPG
jgi:16S rRNA (guanine527-N7)-methyltransferase